MARKALKLIFFGTAEFAVPSLAALLEAGFQVGAFLLPRVGGDGRKFGIKRGLGRGRHLGRLQHLGVSGGRQREGKGGQNRCLFHGGKG